ncbi:MAG: 8-oxo-dGTP pyrophosphatase MutT (NUDIX family) [Candidatus Azotimanducaceae bacterium]|jgi:8-oxo-dGTP pyrophosphatase MutT (NUDIX family)|tara:strand:- start:3698 stop:4294 length:597 start_codon:yes stop_codon:yes gene_type:complete
MTLLRSRLATFSPAPRPEKYHSRADAAVLVLIRQGLTPSLILTVRASNLSSHAGEVSLPGGKRDPGDANLAATALRETVEELGIAVDQLELIGALPGLISKHGLWVTPFVGVMPEAVELKANIDEVGAVFEVPLAWLAKDLRVGTERLARQGEVQMAPIYEYQGHRIWGLTALILLDFLTVALTPEVGAQCLDSPKNN